MSVDSHGTREVLMRERAEPVADGREEARGLPALDRMARLAARLLSAPAAIASLIDGERAVHAGSFGLPEPAASNRSAPLSQSLCPRVAGGDSDFGAPLDEEEAD